MTYVSLHSNVKVDSNLVKSERFALSRAGLKSEIPGPDPWARDFVLRVSNFRENNLVKI
jgi:hypothetical protein